MQIQTAPREALRGEVDSALALMPPRLRMVLVSSIALLVICGDSWYLVLELWEKVCGGFQEAEEK